MRYIFYVRVGCSQVNHRSLPPTVRDEGLMSPISLAIFQKVSLNEPFTQHFRFDFEYLPQNAAGENFRLTR